MRTIKEAAIELNVSPLAIYKRVWNGSIKSIRIGRKQLISIEEIERIKLEGCK